jgi:hypothetical protein
MVNSFTAVVLSRELVLRQIQKKVPDTTNCQLIKGIQMVNIITVVVSSFESVLQKMLKQQ